MTTQAKPWSKLPALQAEIRSRVTAVKASAPGVIRHLIHSETHWLWILLPVLVLTVYVYKLNWPVWEGDNRILLFQPFVLLGAAITIYIQRFEVAELYAELVFVYPEDSPKRRGKLWLTVIGCAFLLAATLSGLATLAIVGLIIVIIGSIYYLYGPLITRALWRPLVFLLVMIPPPVSYLMTISSHLQSGTAFVAAQVLHLVFHDVQALGPVISLPGFLLEVNPDSGGLGILLPVLCLTLVFAMFRQITVNIAVIILFIATIISLFLNVLRVVAIGLLSGVSVDLASVLLGGSPILVTILAFYLTHLATNAVLRPQRKLSDFEQDLLLATQYAEDVAANGESYANDES